MKVKIEFLLVIKAKKAYTIIKFLPINLIYNYIFLSEV